MNINLRHGKSIMFRTYIVLSLLLFTLFSLLPIHAQEELPSIEIFMRQTFPEQPIPDEDWFWYETVREELGFNVNITFVNSNEDVTAQLELRRSLNDLPDLFFLDGNVPITSALDLNSECQVPN